MRQRLTERSENLEYKFTATQPYEKYSQDSFCDSDIIVQIIYINILSNVVAGSTIVQVDQM